MPNVSFSGLLIVAVVAFAALLLLGLSPARRLPLVVLEIASATLAHFGAIILHSLFFSREVTSTASKLVLLGSFVLLALAFAFVVLRLEGSMRFSPVLLKLQETTAQLRLRGAFLRLVAFVALAQGIGLEVIPGADSPIICFTSSTSEEEFCYV